MEESFTITVLHKGTQKELTGLLRISAYTYQFLFKIGDTEIILEKDDEGRLRALVPSAGLKSRQEPDPSLIRVLMEEMEKQMNP
jgi:hypothetical protein